MPATFIGAVRYSRLFPERLDGYDWGGETGNPPMIIYLNDDKPYVHWITHHRQGFVLVGQRKPKWRHLTLHRATCAEVRPVSGKRTHLTTGARFKACALDAGELSQWCQENSLGEPAVCQTCAPLDSETAPPCEDHVTKFGRDILDYVLEAAAIHFDEDCPPYRLSVDDIATCLGKTAAQTAQALRGLLNQELISVRGRNGRNCKITARTIVYPTIRAIRQLDAFRDASDDVIWQELAKLGPPQVRNM